MPFDVATLENIANSALDFHMSQNGAWPQHMQDRPLLKALKAKQKTFPGGKGEIKGRVKGDRYTTFTGFQGSDTVSYGNPNLIKVFSYPWREMHGGIEVTLSELKHDGISVVDSAQSENTVMHSQREKTAIINFFEDKLESMMDDLANDLNNKFWLDGSADAKAPVGLLAYLTETPSAGVTGGIDRASNTWWRHRALTGANKITASTSLQTLTKTLRVEHRQLIRYGGKPDAVFAGADALEAIEAEIHEKGIYTESGFAKDTDIGMGGIVMRGVGRIMYDPTLDDLGLSDHIFFVDTKSIYPMVMEGEDMKRHTPARPAEKYVLYRAVTWTGQLICKKLNSSGRYQVVKP